MKTLYITDLDGTLFRQDESISTYTANVINNFVQSGGLFSYATARPLPDAQRFMKSLTSAIPAINLNGTLIRDTKTGAILFGNYFTANEIACIQSVLTANEIYPICYSFVNGKEKFSHIPRHASEGVKWQVNREYVEKCYREAGTIGELYTGKIVYFSCIETEEKLTPVYEVLKDKLRCIYSKDVYSNRQWLEIMPQNATKANAALKLKEFLKCDKIIAFGDAKNDIPLFEVADDCYAVENATPELKAIATGIIGSNKDDGVAKWLAENVIIKPI